MKTNRLFVPIFTFLFLIVSLGCGTVFARSSEPVKRAPAVSKIPDHAKDEAEHAQKAASVLTEIMSAPDQGIPDELMERAKAIAVIPHMIKGAFGFGGRYGKGLVSQRLSNGRWSAPAFIEIGGASAGFQIGVEATDVVLVFVNDDGVRPLLKGKVKLGADASVAAGPVGRKASVGTDVLLQSGIFAYSRSKGLFAGVSLGGAVVTIDDDDNRDVYGKGVDAHDILVLGTAPVNDAVRPFVDALEQYTPSQRISHR